MSQAKRWQELYEEQGADLLEMQQKLIDMDGRMEEFMNTAKEQIE